MSHYLKVKNKRHLYRDSETKSIISTDSEGLKKAKALKSRLNRKEEEVQELRGEIAELKNLVLSLVEDKNGSDNS